jgi:hypothetical protein
MITNSDQLTVSTSVVALDPLKYDPGTGRDKKAATATISVDADTIRFTVDPDLTPSATVGHKIKSGGQVELTTENEIKNFRVIRDTAATANAILDISYFRGE